MTKDRNALRPDDAPPRSAGILAVLLTAIFIGQFDFSAVNVAAPSLERDLHTGPAALELIVAGYSFAYASGLITGARLGAMFGNRRVFATGMVAFAITSLLCGLATSPSQLVAARLLQGATAALMIPQILAVITTRFPPERRAAALGWYAVAAGLGTIAGQALGGLLVDSALAGWRGIFLVNLPICAVAVPMAVRLLPADREGRAMGLDPVGAAGVSATLALVLVPLGLGNSHGWPLWTWLCLAASIPAATLTLHWQRRLRRGGGQPILDLTLFRYATFRAGVTASVAFLAYFASLLFTVSLLLQRGLGLSATGAGLTFVALGVGFTVSSLVCGRLVARYGLRSVQFGIGTSVVGMATLGIGVHLNGTGIPVAWAVVALAITGLGNGTVFPSLVTTALLDVPPHKASAASGLVTTSQLFAMSAGVAVIGAAYLAIAGPGSAADDHADAIQTTLAIDIALVLTVAVMISIIRRLTQTESQPDQRRERPSWA